MEARERRLAPRDGAAVVARPDNGCERERSYTSERSDGLDYTCVSQCSSADLELTRLVRALNTGNCWSLACVRAGPFAAGQLLCIGSSSGHSNSNHEDGRWEQQAGGQWADVSSSPAQRDITGHQRWLTLANMNVTLASSLPIPAKQLRSGTLAESATRLDVARASGMHAHWADGPLAASPHP